MKMDHVEENLMVTLTLVLKMEQREMMMMGILKTGLEPLVVILKMQRENKFLEKK